MSNLEILTQTFNSPDVNLEITSFKSMKFWGELMKEKELTDIWSFINWLVPNDVFNIHNYQLIKERFMAIPRRKRIIDLLAKGDYYCVVKINLNNAALGCHITIHESKEHAMVAAPYQPDTVELAMDKKSFIIQEYTNPELTRRISLLNQFNFYDHFNNYINLGNSNAKHRTFVTRSEFKTETDKGIIGMEREIDWRGISFERSTPTRDRSRSFYHSVEDTVKKVKDDSSFFEVFRDIQYVINRYIRMANNDDMRITQTTRYNPLCYTESDKVMRDLRKHLNRLKITVTDMEQIFVPYLEIGERINNFTFGVISR